MIFSRGKPMRLKFKYASLQREATQDTKYYTTSPSFQMVMGDGYITVIDPIDDMLMLHSVEWDEDGDETDVRFAWVYRWLDATHDYFADTSKIRRTPDMMKLSAREVTNKDFLERNAFTGND